MEFNYYQILGVSQFASEEEIKAAYKALAKKYHPDKHAGNAVFEEHFKKINAAYQTLSDEHKRKRYDFKLAYASQKPSTEASNTPRRKQPYQRPYTTMKKQPVTPEEQRRNRKYAAIAIVSLILFITGTTFFYNYMNHVTALDRLKEGRIAQAKKEDMNAFQYYTEAIGYDESLTEAYVLRAELLITSMKNYAGAVNDYTSALKHTKDPALYFSRAKCNIKLHNYPDAINDLNKAIELNPDFDSLYYYKGNLNNYVLENYKEAINDYSKALSLNTKFTEALLGRAVSKQNLKDYKGSVTDLNTLIQLKPEDGSYYYYRGCAEFYMNDTGKACNDWFNADKLSFFQARKMLNTYCVGN